MIGRSEHPADPDRRAADASRPRSSELMQKTLDSYGAGILVQQVQLQKVDPPTQVIDSFRDVQAARSDLERAQNEAQTYANRVVPEARGRAAKIIQDAEAYREQTVAEAKGQTSRFTQIYDQYKKAPEVTRAAHVSGNHGARARRHRQDDHRYRPQGGSGVVPYLPLTESARGARRRRRGPRRRREATNETQSRSAAPSPSCC